MQVAPKVSKIIKNDRISQTELSYIGSKDAESQCEGGKNSYSRSDRTERWTYDRLKDEVLCSKLTCIQWCMNEELIARERVCGHCNNKMNLVECKDRPDGYKWECRRQEAGKRHKTEISIRRGSWFEKSNMTMEEILKFTYWWCRDLKQEQIRHELNLVSNTAVDWDSFCRETCEVTLLEREEKIGGPGKIVQIDESKFGRRKYHRGHRVDGQWVFGGIEEETRRSFMVAVDKRDEATLLPLIERHIEKGTMIVSDCWKGYINLTKHGYEHRLVNHSKEFVNSEGFHTNKIESLRGIGDKPSVKFPLSVCER